MLEQNALDRYRRWLRGDTKALEELVEEYGDALVRFAYCLVKDSAVAEDIMEDSFAALVVRRRLFSDCDNFRAYLYKVARNKCIDYLRRHKKQVPLSDLENVLHTESAEEDVLRKAQNRTLYRCMQSLPKQYEEVLYLAYFECYSPAQIAKIVKRTKKQVYNLLARAKTSLKERLEKEGFSHENV